MIAVLMVSTESFHFAFRREDVEAVLLLPRLHREPGDIPLIEGWVDLRGDKVPVIALSAVLGLGQEDALLSDHLVLTPQLPRVAWRVRRAEGLGQVSWESLRLLEHSAEPTPCYVADFTLDGRNTRLINVAGLLLAEEQERLRCSEEKRRSRIGRLRAP